jgi:hypothetical protein
MMVQNRFGEIARIFEEVCLRRRRSYEDAIERLLLNAIERRKTCLLNAIELRKTRLLLEQGGLCEETTLVSRRYRAASPQRYRAEEDAASPRTRRFV